MTVTRSRHRLMPNNFYPTPSWATEALLLHLPVAGLRIWEPAAGDHKMADVLRRHGAGVLTSDIASYGRSHNLTFDFLQEDSAAPWHVDGIITNPPYGARNELAVRFAHLALQRCKRHVALLLTANFDSASTRLPFFRSPRFKRKIVLVDRLRFFGGKGSTDGTSDHAWFIWGPGSIREPVTCHLGKRDVR